MDDLVKAFVDDLSVEESAIFLTANSYFNRVNGMVDDYEFRDLKDYLDS